MQEYDGMDTDEYDGPTEFASENGDGICRLVWICSGNAGGRDQFGIVVLRRIDSFAHRRCDHVGVRVLP